MIRILALLLLLGVASAQAQEGDTRSTLSSTLQLLLKLNEEAQRPEPEIHLELRATQNTWQATFSDRRVDPPFEPPSFVIDGTLVLPLGVPIRIDGTASDLLQPLSFPALGVNVDLVPGRLQAVDLVLHEVGNHEGDCGNFCDASHAIIDPLVLRVVDDVTFQEWLATYGN